MPEMEDAIEFLTRFIGGAASALTENAFVAIAQRNPDMFGEFPYNEPVKQLPYAYRMIVGGISLGEFLLGLGLEEDPLKLLDAAYPTTKMHAQQFGKNLRKFGEGGVMYSVPMLTARTIVKNVPAPSAAKPPGTPTPPPPASNRGRVIKL
jgi:hypothetical protein